MTKVEAANPGAKNDHLCCPKLVLVKAGMLGKNEAYKFDMAAKRRKKHKNKISGLVISKCYETEIREF